MTDQPISPQIQQPLLENQTPSRKKRRLTKKHFIILGAIIVGLIIAVYKKNHPDFNVYIAVMVLAAFIFVAFIALKLIEIYKGKTVKKEGLPKPITIEQARAIAISMTEDSEYADYTRSGLGEKVLEVGKNTKSRIYTRKSRGEYENQIYVVVMNMHYPKEKCAVLIDPTEWEISRTRNGLADFPEDEPTIKESIMENPLLGTRNTIKEIIRAEQQEKKKEDL